MTGHGVPVDEAEFTMRYMMLIHHDDEAMAKAPPSLWGDYAAFNEAIAKADIAYQPGNRLQPSSAATTVRVTGDETAVLDGPYADTKEQLAGYFMIDAPDLDQAIAWAALARARATGASRYARSIRADVPAETSDDAGRAAERVARESFGRLVAFLAARTRDVAAAEDALSEAFAAALRQWPKDGVPENPAAWLLSVARRRGADEARRRAVETGGADRLALMAEELEAVASSSRAVPDQRLALMFACAHPAHPADGAGPHRRGHSGGLPRVAQDDGPAVGAG
jgi:hypothetical protein